MKFQGTARPEKGSENGPHCGRFQRRILMSVRDGISSDARGIVSIHASPETRQGKGQNARNVKR
jgi:hypothetical protein